MLLPANFEAYRHYSRLFKSAVATIAPNIEDQGIDEIYLDLSDIDEPTVPLAQRIKQAVLDATGLTCSIGVTPNKLLAKIASDLDKPDGLTVLTAADIPTRIWPLAARKSTGLAQKAASRLERLGIVSIETSRKRRSRRWCVISGLTGQWLHRAAHGIDDQPVVTTSEPKSISRESTFERDLHPKTDRAALSGILVDIALGWQTI